VEGVAAPVCKLLTHPAEDVPLETQGCPGWVFPNADAAGYFRFSLAPADLAKLRTAGLSSLTAREKASFASSVSAAYARGAMSFKEAIDALAPLARDTDPNVAVAPMAFLVQARDWLYATPQRAKVEAYGRTLYGKIGSSLGWESKPGESDETRTLRARVLGFLAMTARDSRTRAEAKKRGLAYIGNGAGDGVIHEDALDPNLATTALAVVGEEADAATWERMKKMFTTAVDETVRGRLLVALSSAKAPDLAVAARGLVLDPVLRDNEVLAPLSAALGDPEKRDAAWAWMKANFDAIRDRLPHHHGGTALVGMGGVYCDGAHAGDMEAFFKPKIDGIEGGPRVLASTLEDVRLCAARRKAQEGGIRSFFGDATTSSAR
jgi:alanyl aminopeptidase